ncbi:hypothetical protein A3L12_02905 [Thermococcus sp. P6]|uniref:tripartite tricarboxylate transporter permease n=1 Tax=Thermococcus sp. P6 TaxID=122420 RepID=UPI000B59EC41|nr:tripartite tricarboxylate transporter permease [Thermococcus sp. P6]ASJ10319.1 hypothetical protein A3L12_02905 [Thermococcus sp. P6]
MIKELILGVLGGTVTGLTPALHANTLASILEGVDLPLRGLSFVLLIYAMGLTHTFLDAFPSTFFGVPEEGTALAILPAHRLAMEGKGLEVVNISLKASLLAVIFSTALFPLYSALAPHYNPLMGRIAVVFLALLIILTESGIKKLYALLVFLMAGALGIVSELFPLREPFYHLFVGLFGVPVILLSLRNEGRVRAGDEGINMETPELVRFSLAGTFFGMLSSMLPAFTPSQAALVGTFFTKGERPFLTIVFSVNTANFVFGLENFYLTGRTRNGILALMGEHYFPISRWEFLILLVSSFAVAGLVNLYGLPLSRFVAGLLENFSYRKLNLAVLVLLFTGSFLLDGLLGVLLLGVSSLVGLSAPLLGVKRTACMGVLMLPIIIGPKAL